ncbi:auxin-responsive protein IAA31 isoform X2 [Mangifera indica]|uniref:auxin-responsive protein IAA31 isoform X2 n=1 Tax=Mangifera indica TaxID=29780 RepID=UPI001CF9EA05|nr:auxin-responsive protein IAA31 isoform X2 [Mangifera indica]
MEQHQVGDHSCPSSIDSSNHPPFPSSSGVSSNIKRDLCTDLRLGLSISPSTTHDNDDCSTSNQNSSWAPIKRVLRSRVADNYVQEQERHDNSASLFVKVYMEGIPIGRKLDVYAHGGYKALISTLANMFKTSILCPDMDGVHWNNIRQEKQHVLTYEDKEGNWMMAGDVPWEMFLPTVKRLKIARADRDYSFLIMQQQ